MAAADQENWRQKYFDGLSSLENEQRRFRASEAALKRIAGRLCTAALGQSPTLDEQIKKLQNAIRRDVSSEELDAITPALTTAIQALDQAPAPTVIPSSPSIANAVSKSVTDVEFLNEAVRATIAALLIELRRDEELAKQADAMDAQLNQPITSKELPSLISSLADMVGQRIARIERAKQEVEVLLSHMVGKLDEISHFVADQNRSQSESHASSETLNVQLAGEMKAIGESVEAARDLQQIRVQVRTRLDSIDRHLLEFREREATLASTMRARNDQLRLRIAELEAEANRLHTQLQDEQRSSTIDVLTKIPNRSAYDKRLDEEIKRWQRFKQPTCIAVWDVDHFKRVNDTYGHRAGDRVLQAVAECLAARIRSTDFLARYGGEEFVMILPGTKLDDAMRVIDELRVAISMIGFHFRGNPVAITISSGVTQLATNDTAGAAFDRADKALYRAKEKGRNRCMSG